jgi:hypothetical protein
VRHYNWSKHRACSTIPDKNGVGRSILLGLKKHFLIRAKLSELGYFRRFPKNIIQYIRKAFKSHNKTGLGLELD